jgi:hypothetical protein
MGQFKTESLPYDIHPRRRGLKIDSFNINWCFGGGVSISQGDSLRVYTFLFVA